MAAVGGQNTHTYTPQEIVKKGDEKQATGHEWYTNESRFKCGRAQVHHRWTTHAPSAGCVGNMTSSS